MAALQTVGGNYEPRWTQPVNTRPKGRPRRLEPLPDIPGRFPRGDDGRTARIPSRIRTLSIGAPTAVCRDMMRATLGKNVRSGSSGLTTSATPAEAPTVGQKCRHAPTEFVCGHYLSAACSAWSLSRQPSPVAMLDQVEAAAAAPQTSLSRRTPQCRRAESTANSFQLPIRGSPAWGGSLR